MPQRHALLLLCEILFHLVSNDLRGPATPENPLTQTRRNELKMQTKMRHDEEDLRFSRSQIRHKEVVYKDLGLEVGYGAPTVWTQIISLCSL